jgi:hypothetical protein
VHRADRAWHLYARVARDAGIGGFAGADRWTDHHPHVQARPVVTKSRTLLWLINRSDRAALVLPRRPLQLVFPGPRAGVEEAIELGPKGVVVAVPAAQDGHA